MTITVDLTPKGSVGVRADSGKDRAFLRRIPYLVRRDGLAVTWWTYLGDLRRDLRSRKTKWTPRVKRHLPALLEASRLAATGDDDELTALFHPQRPPYSFQRAGIHFGLNVERCLIADDTGLGKTIQAMGVFFVAHARGTARRGLIVCPSGLKLQWYNEIHDFSRSELDARIVHPGAPKRRRALYEDKGWQLLIVNPELLLRDREAIEKIKGLDYVAVDEASMIRNPETAIAQTLKELFGKTRYRLALTATPVENRLRDLFSVFEFVDHRVFISEDYFNSRYINWRKIRFTVKKKGGRQVRVTKTVPDTYKNLGEVKNKIRSSYIRRRVSDVGLELPALVVQWEILTMPPRQKEIYQAIREETEKKIKNLRGAALLQPLQGLRQACNSTRLVTKGKGLKRPGQVKIDRLLELLDTELAGEQVICFTDYERFATLLVRAMNKRGITTSTYTGQNKRERDRELRAFAAGDRDVLVATRAAERGHNLQNASIVVNVDLPFNPAAIKQRLGRVRRLNSKHGVVRMLNMVCEGTIEESLIMHKIYSRRQTFEALFGEDELTQADPLESLIGEGLL